jgi:hypothetical protein
MGAISDRLVRHIEDLQEKADRSFALYPEHQCILPNDAVYLARLTNLRKVCDIIEQGMVQFNKTLPEVINLSIKPNMDVICSNLPFIDEALAVIVRDFGGDG